MAHYAQVIDGVVKNLTVFEDESLVPQFEASMGGKFLKASYNTRDGVHYGQDGKPDGGEALRFNYPQIGYIYNETLDGFFPPSERLQEVDYFDPATQSYKLPLPNRAAKPFQVALSPKKIYLSKLGIDAMGAVTMANLTQAVGAHWTLNIEEADIALPVTDWETRQYALRPEFRASRPMTSRALWNVTDRLLMQKLHMPVLPAWRGRTREEMLAIEGPIFVKRQRTHQKDTTSAYAHLSYTHWPSAQAFVDAVDEGFWAHQQTPPDTFGEFIFQPYIAPPFQDLDVRIAVNDQSEVHVWCLMQMVHEEANVLGRWTPYPGDCTELIEKIKLDVKEQGLKAGIHLLQFAPYQGGWALMDWNSRITGCHVQLFPSVYPVLDDAFLHMLGKPLEGRAEGLYCEQRSYRAWGGLEREAVEHVIGKIGLFGRYVNNKLQRVAGIGASKREVSARYDALDQQLSVLFGPLAS